MKKIPYLVILLLFTANLTSAQTINLTANAQDTRDTTKTLIYFGADEWGSWLTSASVQPGIVSYPGCDATCVATINKVGSQYAYRTVVRQMVITNRANHYFAAGVLTEGGVPNAFTKFKKTLKRATVDCMGNSFRAMCVTQNLTTGEFGSDWVTHPNAHLEEFILSEQGGEVLISALAECGQPVDSLTMYMIRDGRAKIVTTTANNNTGPNNNTANSGGNLSVQDIIAIINATKQPIIISNIGNNNGATVYGGGGANGQNGTNGSNATGVPNSPFGQGWTPVATYTLPTSIVSTPAVTSTPATVVTTSTGTACGNCGYAQTKEDVALLQKQGQLGNQLAAQQLKVAKSQRDWQIAGFVFDRAKDGYDILVDQGIVPSIYDNGGTVNNFFASGGSTTTTTTDNGGSVDFPNGGGQAGCIASGGTWDGFQCKY